jgi:hypothetical protein
MHPHLVGRVGYSFSEG